MPSTLRPPFDRPKRDSYDDGVRSKSPQVGAGFKPASTRAGADAGK